VTAPLPRENIEALAKIAVDHYGTASQLDVAQEELAELVVAISHYRRGRDENRKRIIEEIADVVIVVQQLRLVFGKQEVDDVVQQKLRRLKTRIREDRAEAGQATAVIGSDANGQATIQGG